MGEPCGRSVQLSIYFIGIFLYCSVIGTVAVSTTDRDTRSAIAGESELCFSYYCLISIYFIGRSDGQAFPGTTDSRANDIGRRSLLPRCSLTLQYQCSHSSESPHLLRSRRLPKWH